MKMVTVPAGTADIGTSDQQIDRLISQTDWAAMWVKKGFFKREQPQHEVHVDTFSIGIHPVTVEQYQAFIDAGGYATGRYWAENGRLWREMNGVNNPAFWDDELWTGDPHLPVGSYNPAGDSPFGCREMLGNVSEWTLGKFAPYPYVSDDGHEELKGQAERITRGGSWHSPDFRARISARGMNDPSFQDNDLGFRIVSNITGCS